MSEKRCAHCGQVKPLSAFHKRKRSPDGLQASCIECRCNMSRDYGREYQRARMAKDPAGFRKRWREKSKVDRMDPVKRKKIYARWTVYDAVRKGKLVRQPCRGCGVADVQAHHHDYAKPLEVEWLCVACHSKEHMKYG